MSIGKASCKLFFPQKDVERIKEDVERILQSGMLTHGEYTRHLEIEYAKLCDVGHARAHPSRVPMDQFFAG